MGTFFYHAIKSLGITVASLDNWHYYPIRRSKFHSVFIKIFRKILIRPKYNFDIRKVAGHFKPDLILVVKGYDILPATLQKIKTKDNKIINYATDDPFNNLVSSPNMVQSIPFYDHYFCTKRAVIQDIIDAGCVNTSFLPFAYDPAIHYYEKSDNDEGGRKYSSDVAFIGGADQDRSLLVEAITSGSGLNLHLYGGYWNKYPKFNSFYRGFAFDRDYRLALSGTKIALGLVRHSNRDGHSMRSFEIPACGAFMLAERTEEHSEIFVENVDCAYFSGIEELVGKLKHYLGNQKTREKIGEAGFLKIVNGKHTYQDRVKSILQIIG